MKRPPACSRDEGRTTEDGEPFVFRRSSSVINADSTCLNRRSTMGPMPIDVTQLVPQLRQMSERTSAIYEQRRRQIARMQRVFAADFDPQTWNAVCAAAANLSGVKWVGALVNTGEAINVFHNFGDEPDDYALIATDGSQIMPDRHKAVQYAAIQVASTVIIYGLAAQPELLADAIKESQHKPFTLMGEDRLIDAATGELVLPGQISTERDLQEIELLATQCERFQAVGLQPVAVADGSLAPFSLLNELFVRNSAKEAGEQLSRIARALDRMRRCNAIVAGYIDRPNSNALARSCALVDVPPEAAQDEALLRQHIRTAERNMLSIADRHVLSNLLPGTQRTALFEPTWLINGPSYLGRFGHTMRCCYMNTAKQGARPQIARLEMPAWCAGEQSIGIMTDVMGRHARMGGEYPLCLKAAHEEAVLTLRDEYEIDQMLERSLIEQGVMATPSAKQEAKDRR